MAVPIDVSAFDIVNVLFHSWIKKNEKYGVEILKSELVANLSLYQK
jgi:hypothetical protein